jgi:uncharacterized glyoxalase superfamily protein PhnB
MSTPIDTIPARYGTVMPWIISTNAAGLIAFPERAFDGELAGRVDNPDGTGGHSEVKIGTSIVMMFDGKPEWGSTPAFCDSTCRTPRQASRRHSRPVRPR